MPQLSFDPSVPAADQADLTKAAADMTATLPEINKFLAELGGGFSAGFTGKVFITMNHRTYLGGTSGRLEAPPNPNPGKVKHLWQVPRLGALTSNDRRNMYLAPPELYWVGIPPKAGKKTLVERFIHEMVHAAVPGIAGEHDPHKPEFYMCERQWFSLLGRPFPPAEAAALQMSLHEH